jgi:nitrogen fixation/metabolism regulation signal transduction histidine kinase
MLARGVATIVAQVQAMKQLVDEFRDYARLPAARLHPLELNALVLEVLALYAAPQEQGRLLAELEPGLPAIEGDLTQLRQVIHNLVQNALDAVEARPDGLVRVVTETARNEGGELRAVRLRVSDNGGGFGEKVLKRAFEPYVTTKPKGTGLGLAVVKKIADEHGARVRIVNRRADAPAAPVAGAGPSVVAGGQTPGAAVTGGLDGTDTVPALGAVIGAQVSLSFSRFAQRTAAPAVPGQTPRATDMPASASPQNPAPAAPTGADRAQ